MIAKCNMSGFERKLSNQAVTINLGKFGEYLNFYCERCEDFHIGKIKGSGKDYLIITDEIGSV